MKRRSLLAGLGSLAGLTSPAGLTSLAGCSVLPQQAYMERRDWPLVVRRPSQMPPSPSGRVLLVREVQPAPGLEARGLQWLQRDGSLHVDYYEQWAVPPAQAVEDDLRQWLSASGVFGAVLAPGSRVRSDLVLEAELTALLANPGAGVARVALALVLLDQRPSPNRILLQKTVTAEAKLTVTDAPAMVQAIKAALADVLQQTETDLAAVVRTAR